MKFKILYTAFLGSLALTGAIFCLGYVVYSFGQIIGGIL